MIEWLKENHHLLEAIFWALLMIPTLLWWKNSVMLVLIMSGYANYKTAIGAHEGRKARRAAECGNDDV